MTSQSKRITFAALWSFLYPIKYSLQPKQQALFQSLVDSIRIYANIKNKISKSFVNILFICSYFQLQFGPLRCDYTVNTKQRAVFFCRASHFLLYIHYRLRSVPNTFNPHSFILLQTIFNLSTYIYKRCELKNIKNK